ncbi:hypothetical protein RFI_21352 [Reticulomyxa filosa]|uniref:Uncharacterized protein n=1 Tax=Reticulomyxa filosa TaxID=46433 RepID=X6MRE1_RETFI|nr:hypothetical protein RFI_21352 [Reticulomyxa filosa]|eukprot:ETO16007.1 hypothetical protein RFI_21352 [Reticulomyxa filosa]
MYNVEEYLCELEDSSAFDSALMLERIKTAQQETFENILGVSNDVLLSLITAQKYRISFDHDESNETQSTTTEITTDDSIKDLIEDGRLLYEPNANGNCVYLSLPTLLMPSILARIEENSNGDWDSFVGDCRILSKHIFGNGGILKNVGTLREFAARIMLFRLRGLLLRQKQNRVSREDVTIEDWLSIESMLTVGTATSELNEYVVALTPSFDVEHWEEADCSNDVTPLCNSISKFMKEPESNDQVGHVYLKNQENCLFDHVVILPVHVRMKEENSFVVLLVCSNADVGGQNSFVFVSSFSFSFLETRYLLLTMLAIATKILADLEKMSSLKSVPGCEHVFGVILTNSEVPVNTVDILSKMKNKIDVIILGRKSLKQLFGSLSFAFSSCIYQIIWMRYQFLERNNQIRFSNDFVKCFSKLVT